MFAGIVSSGNVRAPGYTPQFAHIRSTRSLPRRRPSGRPLRAYFFTAGRSLPLSWPRVPLETKMRFIIGIAYVYQVDSNAMPSVIGPCFLFLHKHNSHVFVCTQSPHELCFFGHYTFTLEIFNPAGSRPDGVWKTSGLPEFARCQDPPPLQHAATVRRGGIGRVAFERAKNYCLPTECHGLPCSNASTPLRARPMPALFTRKGAVSPLVEPHF